MICFCAVSKEFARSFLTIHSQALNVPETSPVARLNFTVVFHGLTLVPKSDRPVVMFLTSLRAGTVRLLPTKDAPRSFGEESVENE